jgi:predicted  nucleic acid-binding Zn-ribbon protein
MNSTDAQMDRVEINKSIMELNFKKEKLQRQIDQFQAHINHLVALREMKQFDETPLFDELFGG